MTSAKITSRQRILSSAIREFASKGFAGARVDSIARGAEVNKAMIYYHFSSKDKLYEEALAFQMRPVLQFMATAFDEPVEPEAFFARLAEFYATQLEPSGEIIPMLLGELASGGEKLAAIMSETATNTNVTRRFRSLLRRGAREGIFRRVDGKQVIISFIGMNLFYLFFSPLLNRVWEIQDESAFRKKRPGAVVDLFLNGLKAR
jgi:TetR/AcrR family transcriptional regulator